MHASIAQMCMDLDPEKQQMAQSMKAKYDKYWDNIDNINFLLYVAVVLDPRNKLCYLEYCLGQVYGMGSPKTKEIVERVVKTLDELFNHYKGKAEKANARKKNSSSKPPLPPLFGGNRKSLESNFLKFLEENGRAVNKTEVDIYLSDGMEKRDENFDILGWWKIASLKFPILSQVARHVLAMPISTVASESAFSIGGRVIDLHRSSLTAKTAEALICTQDWVRNTPANLEHQEMAPIDLEELIDNLERIELDEFEPGQKLFETCMDDE